MQKPDYPQEYIPQVKLAMNISVLMAFCGAFLFSVMGLSDLALLGIVGGFTGILANLFWVKRNSVNSAVFILVVSYCVVFYVSIALPLESFAIAFWMFLAANTMQHELVLGKRKTYGLLGFGILLFSVSLSFHFFSAPLYAVSQNDAHFLAISFAVLAFFGLVLLQSGMTQRNYLIHEQHLAEKFAAEGRLRDSQTRERLNRKYQTILENSADGVHLLDKSGNVVECSASFARMLGYSYAEAKLLNVTQWDAQIEDLLAAIRSLMIEPKTFLSIHRRKDGSTFPVQITTRPIEVEGESLLFASARDISELQQLQSEKEAIFDIKSAGLFYQRGRELTFVNATFCEIVGYPYEEVVGFDTLKYHLSQESFQSLGEKMRAGIAEKGFYVGEIPIRRKDGTVLWVQFAVNPISSFEESSVPSFVGVLFDVSAQHELQEKLKHEQQLNQKIIDSAQAVIATIELDGTMSSINEFGEKISGYSAAEIASKPYFWLDNFVPGDIKLEIKDIIESVMEAGEVVQSKENAWISKYGDVHMIEWSNSVLYDDEGTPQKLLTVGIDVTEKYQAKEELYLLNESLEGLVIEKTELLQQQIEVLDETQEVAKISSWRYYPEHQHFWCSEELYRTLEINNVERPLNLWEEYQSFVLEDEREKLAQFLDEAAHAENSVSLTYRIKNARAQIKYMQMVAKPALDDVGEVLFISGTLQDVTEEMALRKQEMEHIKTIEKVQQLSKMGVFEKGVRDTDYWFSDSNLRIWGFETAAGPRVSVDRILERIHVDDLAHVKSTMQTIHQQQFQTESLEYRIVTEAGELKHIRGNVWFLEDESGEIYKMIGVHQDITDEVLTRQKAKANEAVMVQQNRLAQQGEMLQMIGHQWRQPLAQLSLYQQLMQIELANAENVSELTMESIEDSKRIVQFLSQTISDFKEFFSDKKQAVSFGIGLFVDETLRILMSRIDKSDIAVHIDFDSDATRTLTLTNYRSELGQVLLAIFNNAIDVLELQEGERALNVSIADRSEDILLEIRDNAGGIPEEVLPRIFEPYFSTKLELNGTGLGLYMAKMIMENSVQGTISATNQDGGACFTLIIPKKVAE